jgi:hypothetical protein
VLDALVAIAVPIGIFSLAQFSLAAYLQRGFDLYQLGLLSSTSTMLVVAVALAALGASLKICSGAVPFSPAIAVLGYEFVGHHHELEMR